MEFNKLKGYLIWARQLKITVFVETYLKSLSTLFTNVFIVVSKVEVETGGLRGNIDGRNIYLNVELYRQTSEITKERGEEEFKLRIYML